MKSTCSIGHATPPTRTGIGVAGVVFYCVMWAAASSDLIATHFMVSLNDVTYWLRALVIFGPIIGFIVARRIGNPAAVRAVGAANGANPLPPIVPCHRIIGSNGKLTGYGGGLPLKQRLLDLERTALGGEPAYAPASLFTTS